MWQNYYTINEYQGEHAAHWFGVEYCDGRVIPSWYGSRDLAEHHAQQRYAKHKPHLVHLTDGRSKSFDAFDATMAIHIALADLKSMGYTIDNINHVTSENRESIQP